METQCTCILEPIYTFRTIEKGFNYNSVGTPYSLINHLTVTADLYLVRLYQYKYARQGITRNNDICLIYQLALQITSNYSNQCLPLQGQLLSFYSNAYHYKDNCFRFIPMLTITRTTAFVLFQCLPLQG